MATGATSIAESADRFYGDCMAQVTCPFGNFWTIFIHVEDLTPDHIARRVATVERASPPKNGDSVPTAARTSSPPNQGDCKFIGTGYKLHRTGPFRHEVVRREDSNAAKRMQRQQVAVAADDMSGRTAQSQFQELVVFGITARGHCCGHFHQLRFPHQCRQEFQAFVLSQITVESGLRRTSFSSASVAREMSEVPCSRIRSNARRGVDRGNSAALTVTLVSTTARTLLVTQEILQNLRRKPATLGRPSSLVHN